MFYLHVGILHRGYYRLTAGFSKRLHLHSSNYLTSTIRIIIELSAISIANYIQTYWLIILNVTYKLSIAQLKMSVAEWNTSEVDSRWFSLIVRWIPYNIRGEGFQRVGRIYKIKNASFSLWINNFTRIFKILTLFYQVIILLINNHVLTNNL